MQGAAPVLATLVAIALSYFSGSIPTALIAVRLALGKDIRTLGSGNVGATNAFRALGLKAAIPVFLVDFMKGAAPVYIALNVDIGFAPGGIGLAIFCGSAAILGHVFPLWIGFNGGKGVATGAGVMTALYPPLFPACLAVFAITLFATRTMSVASLTTALSLPLWCVAIPKLFGERADTALISFAAAVSITVALAHRKNIRALATGREKKLF